MLRAEYVRPKQLSAIEQQRCTGNHLGCRLWFTRGDPAADVPPSSDSQQLYEQAAEQARLNRAAYAENSELYESALLRLTEQIMLKPWQCHCIFLTLMSAVQR